MRRYILMRLLQLVPTTFGVLLLSFVTFHVIGGSPAEVVLGQQATAEALAEFESRHGYDRPLFFGHWKRVRAFRDFGPDEALERSAAMPGIATARDTAYSLSPAYALPAGVYRWTLAWPRGSMPDGDAGVLVWNLRDTESGGERSETTRLEWRGRTARAELRVEPGAVVQDAALQLPAATAPPARTRLRQRTRHVLDSQFTRYMLTLARGDLGYSVSHDRPVAAVLREGVGPSLSLTLPIFVGGLLGGIFLGLLCAVSRGRLIDRALLFVCAVLMSVNYVVWVIGAQYLMAFRWGWFPLWGYESASHLALPVLIGVFSGLGRDVRFYRTVILDEIYRPYVRAAIARGLAPSEVWVRHVLRNSLIPIVTQLSLSLPFLFMGSLLLESFFGIPGIGGVSLNAIHSADLSVVRAVVILGALLYQGVNLVTDLLYALLDPRVRVQ